MRSEGDDVIKLRRGRAEVWTEKNPILADGEQGLETDTGKFKIGNGLNRWINLDYYLPSADILKAINEAIANATFPGDGGGSNPVPSEALLVHIASSTPHPVYDEGPSLLLLYQNAKV